MTKIKEDGTYPYQPANGTEGEMFMEQFCYRCKKDEAYWQSEGEDMGCPIIILTMTYNPEDAEYPHEWIADDACGLVNPRCTAFEKMEG